MESARGSDVSARGRRQTNVALYHTAHRRRLDTTRQDAVIQTSVAGFGQNETEWTPWLRTTAGLRVDGYRFDVDSLDPANSGTEFAGLVSPKGGAVIGPFHGTERTRMRGSGFTATMRGAPQSRATRRPASGSSR